MGENPCPGLVPATTASRNTRRAPRGGTRPTPNRARTARKLLAT